ncbi:MAG: tetratricopeptide repeat protein, partial [Planctomycetota bacterium]
MGKTQENADRSRGLWLGAGIFLLAMFVRGVYLYESSDNPTFLVPVVDSMAYDQLAKGAAGGKGITEEFFWQQFFYPFFLSVVYLLTGSSIVWAKVVQILLGSVTCVLAYRLGERIFGRAAGVLAGCMAAVYGPLIFFDGELLAAGWASFWAVSLILLFLTVAKEKRLWPCLVLGLCGALSVITRPNFIPFFAAGLLWLIVVWARLRVGAKKLALGLTVITAGFMGVVVPVAAANYRITNNFSFLPGTGGLNLYIGNNPDFEAVSLRPGAEWQRVVDLPLTEDLHTPKEQQRFFYARTFEYTRTQPMSFLKGLLHKGAEFFSSREMPGNIDVYLFTRWSRVLGLLTWKVDGFGFPFGVLLPLALLGFFLCWRKVPVPLALLVILYPASVILTHIEARYRMPVIAPMCVLAAGGLVRVAEMVRFKHRRGLAMAGVFCAGTGLICSIAGPFYSEKHVDYESELYYVLGGSLEQQERMDDAIAAYSKALRLRGDYMEAHHNVGLLLLKKERAEEAFQHLDAALKLEPASSNLHRDFGLALFKLERIDKAMRYYYQAVKINPKNGSAHNYLGLALQSQGKLAEAVRHYELALQIEPQDADVRYNYGIALQLQGRLDEAIRQYKEALRLKPDFINAHSNLGVIFAGQGRLDEAVAHFSEAVRIKPDSAELHCNLALALQSQGKLDQAVEEYRKALAIDPGHKRARQA